MPSPTLNAEPARRAKSTHAVSAGRALERSSTRSGRALRRPRSAVGTGRTASVRVNSSRRYDVVFRHRSRVAAYFLLTGCLGTDLPSRPSTSIPHGFGMQPCRSGGFRIWQASCIHISAVFEPHAHLGRFLPRLGPPLGVALFLPHRRRVALTIRSGRRSGMGYASRRGALKTCDTGMGPQRACRPPRRNYSAVRTLRGAPNGAAIRLMTFNGQFRSANANGRRLRRWPPEAPAAVRTRALRRTSGGHCFSAWP